MHDCDDGCGGLPPNEVVRLSPTILKIGNFGIGSTHMHEHEKGLVHDCEDGCGGLSSHVVAQPPPPPSISYVVLYFINV